MRSIRISQTFSTELAALLRQGMLRFGSDVIAEKQQHILDTINNFLALYPRRPVDPILSICTFPVRNAPFVILYDFDDRDLRIHLIIHEKTDRTLIDLTKVEW